MAGINLNLSGGTRIQTVQEWQWSDVELDFLLHAVPRDEFAATAAAADAQFMNLATGQLRMSSHSTVLRTPHGVFWWTRAWAMTSTGRCCSAGISSHSRTCSACPNCN